MKKCTKCKIEKEESKFFKDVQKRDGYSPRCKECDMKISTQWRKENEVQRRFNVLKSATGVTKDQYLDLLHEQNSCCAICGMTLEQNKRNLSVDHCHTLKLVRGLLCTKCNFGLGYFNDNEELLLKAIHYLNNNQLNKQIKYKC